MTASLEDYLPEGKTRQTLTQDDLTATAKRIGSAGMLRMHAQGRLLDELCEVAEKLGFEGRTSVRGGWTDHFVPIGTPIVPDLRDRFETLIKSELGLPFDMDNDFDGDIDFSFNVKNNSFSEVDVEFGGRKSSYTIKLRFDQAFDLAKQIAGDQLEKHISEVEAMRKRDAEFAQLSPEEQLKKLQAENG